MSERKMVDAFKNGLRKAVPRVYERLRMTKLNVGERSYSQEGEDRVLARYFESMENGFYVDVGAHDPMRFSNTYLFYRRGWRGINIDAMPGSMRLFDRYRVGDINLEVGIGVTKDVMPFYVFNEPALNSFDEQLSLSRNINSVKIINVVDVKILPLAEVIAEHLPRLKGPSFLTVDVEGRDLDALKSNDWDCFRPTFVLAECLGETIESASRGPVSAFMQSKGYEFVAKTNNTAFYRSANMPAMPPT